MVHGRDGGPSESMRVILCWSCRVGSRIVSFSKVERSAGGEVEWHSVVILRGFYNTTMT